jgi:hypothetical protein
MSESLKRLWKGARFPRDNDSAFLLDVHARGIPSSARARAAACSPSASHATAGGS